MKKQPKLIFFLTFDHELPLGGVRTNWDDALFTPTDEILSIAQELDVPVTFFTDILSALRFKEWDYEGFYVPYKTQIINAFKAGHDIQLHLHPHWLTSNFLNHNFIPSGDYSLSDFAIEKHGHTIESIIKQGILLLNEILKPEHDSYKCLAFRAGGYNLGDEKSRSRILNCLYENGIRFDSSIAKGYFYSSDLSIVDYRSMPNEANWHLNHNGNLKINASTGIFEIPIGSIPKSIFEVPTFLKMKKLAGRAPLSRGYQIHDGKPGTLMNKFKQFMSTRMLGFDNYTYEPEYLLKILNHHISKHANDETIMVSIVGHPKTMGNYAHDMMRYFVKTVKTKYPEATFSKFSDI